MAANDDVNIPELSDDSDDDEVFDNQDGVWCCICSSTPTPPVYHCDRNHVVCGKCMQALESSTACPLMNCDLETCICNISSILISNLDLMCPNKSIGDLYTCPFKCGVQFPDIPTLKIHLDSHAPIEVTVRQNAQISLVHGGKLLLKEKGSETFFLLSFNDSCVLLNHMWWDESRTHSLALHGLSLRGKTSDPRSSSPLQTLRLPPSLLRREAITLTLSLDEESGPKPTLKDLEEYRDGLGCGVCFKIVTPDVYHCSHPKKEEDHLLCHKCFAEIPKPKECLYCRIKGKKARICLCASYILRNTLWNCCNQNMGCQHLMPIEDYEEHVDRCLNMKYHCPICTRGFDVLDHPRGRHFPHLESLRSHLLSHPKQELNYMKETSLIVGRGRSLLQMEDDYYLLIFEKNRICLQHMPWAQEQEYSIGFQDVACEWHYGGKTTQVEKNPRLSARFLTIPETVLHPESTRPIPILVKIVP